MITILTLYNEDDTLFNNVELPKRPFTNRGYNDLYLEGFDCDKTTFINNLLLELAELNVIYTDPDFMKFAITQWANAEKHNWQSLFETCFYKYNPIWNKDGTIKDILQETRNLTDSKNATITSSRTKNTTLNEDALLQTILPIQHALMFFFRKSAGLHLRTE